MFSLDIIRSMNSPKGNTSPSGTCTSSQFQAKKESRTRYYKELAAKASKTVLITIAFVSVSLTSGVLLSDRVEAQTFETMQVIQFDYNQCVELFIMFYSKYPGYHYENENNTLSIDFVIPNPEENGAQYCYYFFYGE